MDWFHFETNGCNLKSVLDKLVYEYFGEGSTIKYQPPILIDGEPSSTYYRLEYGVNLPLVTKATVVVHITALKRWPMQAISGVRIQFSA